MKYILLPVLASLLSIQPALGQYRGGSRDGYSILQAKGIQNNLPGIYNGGPNDGHARFTTTTQNAIPGIYSGGNNDGVAFSQAKGAQNTIPEIYAGGANDGFSFFSAATQNALPGIYYGGSNDGFSGALASTQNTTPPIYLGGANDGVDMWSGGRGQENELPAIYRGGANDGDAEDGYAFAVSLQQNGTEPPIIRGERKTTLIDLSGTWFNDDAVLAWSTSTSSDLNHFELQRSADGGGSFEAIGTIELNPEAGNQQEYRYTDVRAYHLSADFLLYRLKCVDKQGGFRYSAIVRLSKDKTAPVIVAYPNPTSGRFTLAMLNVTDVRGYGYILSNAEGKILKRGSIESASSSFDLSGYSAASYHLFLYKDGKSIQHFTILLTQ